ncbi:unnamed protein product, partial [Porites lobata]
YHCDICGKTFDRSDNLNTQSSIHTGEKPFECTRCYKTCSDKSALNHNLNTHSSIHTGEKPFECTRCYKTCSDKSALNHNLNTHSSIHTGEKPFECTRCYKTCSDKSALNPGTEYHCDICGKTFDRSDNLNTHSSIHTGEKPFECTRCYKACSDKSALNHNLNTHSSIHTGEKPFECTRCYKTSTCSQQVQCSKSGIKREKAGTEYHCDICGKTFDRSDNLNTQSSIHTGEKPFECTRCYKTCSDKSALNQKAGTEYHCDICGKTFDRSDNLNTQSSIHTGEKPFECTRCYKTCSDKSALNRHLKAHNKRAAE